jgi:hypothetical protein
MTGQELFYLMEPEVRGVLKKYGVGMKYGNACIVMFAESDNGDVVEIAHLLAMSPHRCVHQFPESASRTVLNPDWMQTPGGKPK